ncbi:MAG: FAD-binding protein [Clostridiaceae bacterium]|nr:FAD-binding protein [Clostridiaceae bacterium]
MSIKKLLSFVLVICMVIGLFSGCSQDTGTVLESDNIEPEISSDVEETQMKMKPGTYTASGVGFRLFEEIDVNVTVDETSILDIEVSMDNGETKPILQTVIDKMIPRIIEEQSIYVDAITGATASSAAVRVAVTEALSSALEAGGSPANAIDTFKKLPKKVENKETINTKVLVIGMGGSGTVTAMRVAEEMYEADPSSVSVLAIDKAGKFGGTSAVTSEMFAVNAPRFQEEFNEGKDYVNKEQLRQAWLEYTEGDAKTEIVDLFLDNSGKVVDWLMYEHGFSFSTPKRGFTEADIYEVKYQYLPNDTGTKEYDITNTYFEGLVSDYIDLGGDYMLETEAYELIYDELTNTVKGVKARKYDGTKYEIYADAVVLATGGFAGNTDMHIKYFSNEYYPLKGAWKHYGMHQNDGKMIENSIDIGAGTYNIGMPPMVHVAGTPDFLTNFDKYEIPGVIGRMTGRISVWTPGDIPLDMVVASNSLAVNGEGKRFTSETGVGMLDPWKSGANYFSIWSNDQVQKIKEEGFSIAPEGPATAYLGHQAPIPANTPLPETYEVLQAAIDKGFVYKADTIAELAKQINLDPATLEDTVAKYNKYCKSGKDLDFNKPAEFLVELGSGPYYAIIGAPYCYSTCGALDIDENFNVLLADGVTPINGLYAVGTDSMGVLFTEKKPYVTFGGAAQGWAFTSGYLAGEIVSEYVLNK